jgi:septal ring-binding cell division protein DamX
VNIKRLISLLNLSGLVVVVIFIHGCSNEPVAWTKSSSPWERSKPAKAEAPAAEAYKADLDMPEDRAGEVELSYQPEPVQTYEPEPLAEPESELEPEPVAAPLEEPRSEVASIMDQPANYYTLQLMASVDIDRVIQFAEQNQISTQYVVATERDGVIWHVLLLDVFPDYSSAVAARDEIAPSLTNAPWIRKVGSVQALVR